MFACLYKIENIDVSNFDTPNVETMRGLFFRCRSLKSIDLSSFTTSNTTNISAMFSDCHQITSINLKNFDTSHSPYMSEMFAKTYCLSKLTLGNKFSFIDSTSYPLAPDPGSISGANWYWYAGSTGQAYEYNKIPNNKADTYYAVPPSGASYSLRPNATLSIEETVEETNEPVIKTELVTELTTEEITEVVTEEVTELVVETEETSGVDTSLEQITELHLLPW